MKKLIIILLIILLIIIHHFANPKKIMELSGSPHPASDKKGGHHDTY